MSDTSWDIPALGGFPGGYTKDIGMRWNEQDWLTIMSRHSNKTICCIEHLVFYDSIAMAHFSQTYAGVFLAEARGPIVDEAESFERVISLNGKDSLSEQIAKKAVDVQALGHWIQLGEWLVSQHA